MTWRSKKYAIGDRSSAEAEFRAVTQWINLLWLRILLIELRMEKTNFMRLYYDKVTIDIAYNPIQHDKIKHVEIDKNFIKEKLESGLICILFVITQAISGY